MASSKAAGGLTSGQVAAALGVSLDKIKSLVERRLIDEPRGRLGKWRLFSAADVKAARVALATERKLLAKREKV